MSVQRIHIGAFRPVEEALEQRQRGAQTVSDWLRQPSFTGGIFQSGEIHELCVHRFSGLQHEVRKREVQANGIGVHNGVAMQCGAEQRRLHVSHVQPRLFAQFAVNRCDGILAAQRRAARAFPKIAIVLIGVAQRQQHAVVLRDDPGFDYQMPVPFVQRYAAHMRIRFFDTVFVVNIPNFRQRAHLFHFFAFISLAQKRESGKPDSLCISAFSKPRARG